jgi:GMP synthase (glutamine-hydrolysing)
MAKKLGVNLISINAADRFVKALEDVAEPEEKRRIIGREFIRVFEEVAKRVNADYLLQGTIYPDRIESGGSQNASVIKTHHNVGGLPSSIRFKGLIEPLKDLYKDEVREVAIKLGIPRGMVHRQPFPGPGLAVRIMGSVTKEKLRLIREVDAIVREELDGKRANLGLWQYFAVLTDTKSTGVKGDERAYGYVVAIRCVASRDAMTASFARVPYDTLEKVSSRITNEVPEVSRVVYDISNKPPSTIEWE